MTALELLDRLGAMPAGAELFAYYDGQHVRIQAEHPTAGVHQVLKTYLPVSAGGPVEEVQ